MFRRPCFNEQKQPGEHGHGHGHEHENGMQEREGCVGGGERERGEVHCVCLRLFAGWGVLLLTGGEKQKVYRRRLVRGA